MDIDNRISEIIDKMKKLSSKNPKFHCGKFPPEWKPPISESEVETFEKEKDIKLPEDYRRFITTAVSSGTQPFYGLYGLTEKKPSYTFEPVVEKPFPYTIKNPLFISEISDEKYEKLFSDEENDYMQGYIRLCTEGCGIQSILIVNTNDEETYGTVWFYDLCSDFGIAPIFNPQTKKPMSFLDWFEYWVDKTLELPNDEYFSYIELT